MQPREISDLQDEISAIHGCKSNYCRTVHIRESVDGGPVWDGFVKVFDLSGHAEAECCYAWTERVEGRLQITTILSLPPIDSPESAVRAVLAGSDRVKMSVRTQDAADPLA